MSKLLTRIITTTAVLSTFSVTAFAGSPMLKQADVNNDGLIQLSEFTAFADQKFATIDADGNGLVTKEERKAQHKAQRAQKGEARAKAKFAKLDSNGDGSISETEFMAAKDARKERAMKRRDVNGDGQVNQEDRDARKAKFKKMHKKMKAHKGEHKGKRPKVDTNGDGVIDLAEHQAATLARFERMDKDADGVLSADEQRAPKGMRAKHKKQHGKKQHGMRQ